MNNIEKFIYNYSDIWNIPWTDEYRDYRRGLLVEWTRFNHVFTTKKSLTRIKIKYVLKAWCSTKPVYLTVFVRVQIIGKLSNVTMKVTILIKNWWKHHYTTSKYPTNVLVHRSSHGSMSQLTHKLPRIWSSFGGSWIYSSFEPNRRYC